MNVFTLQQILLSTNGTARRFESNEVSFPTISIDSRNVSEGCLFWALAGEHHDGHHFLENAFQNGATAAVVQQGQAENTSFPCIEVEDTYKALSQFASAYRQEMDALIIGVTGSVGKTTTREMIYSTLQTGFSGVRSPRNYNNDFGVPLSLLEIEPKNEFAVLELGAAQEGDLDKLLKIVRPEIGVVTEVGPSHLTGFGQLDKIAHEKQKLVAAIPDTGFVVLNGDSPRICEMAALANCPVITVGLEEHNTLQATNIQFENGKIWFEAAGNDYFLPALGEHHIRAALCSIAIGQELGLSLDAIRDGIADFKPVAGRSAWKQVGDVIVVDDTYNANPVSMKAAIDSLRTLNVSGKRILVVGDMLELGPGEIFFHQQLGQEAAKGDIDLLISFGDFAGNVVAGAKQAGMSIYQTAECNNLDSVLALLSCWVERGDAILVKGSRGMQMERITTWLAEHLQENNAESILFNTQTAATISRVA